MQTIASNGTSVIRRTKGKLPRLPFVNLKNAVLGKDYKLSVAFVGNKESQNLNKEYRGKNKPTNILSFRLSKTDGEIIICLGQTRKDARNFDRTYKEFIPFLFVHGLFHLKGLSHGSTMEKREALVRKKFGLK
ncbi:MAG: rRNA maturation RNase YbeY [Candidatus Paceibacterota bacterium]|jgi:probable rRNA maturation factor